MSYQAQSWARSLQLPPAPKAVLLALAFRADINQECWPSQRRIAQDTGLSERTVRRHLRWLEATSLIKRKKRFSDDGRQLSDRYVLLFQQDAETTREVRVSTPGRTQKAAGADTEAAKYKGTNQKNKPRESRERLERDQRHAEEAARDYWQNSSPAPDREKWLRLLKDPQTFVNQDEDE